MPRSVTRFMKAQGWTPIRRPPDGATCATCERLPDPEATNYRRSGMITLSHSAPYYCCPLCAQQMYDDEGPADDEDDDP
ncbi:MAG TPA: hypothetical protein VF590_12360 [Isosphaeraceae bacterium]|jgi:hypothetical protein